MIQFEISSIPHNQQRYNTVGDYLTDSFGKTTIKVSEMDDWRAEFLVAFHELIEIALCRHTGVTEAEIDAFDFEYEKNRPAGDASEPGDDLRAPYHEEHLFANQLEEMMCQKLDLDFNEYNEKTKELMV